MPSLLRAALLVALTPYLPPRDWGGGYGRDPETEWTYECSECGATTTRPRRPEKPPICPRDRSHKRMELREL